jgi:hypothetical protein
MTKWTTRAERYEPVEIDGVRYEVKAKLSPVEDWSWVQDTYGDFAAEGKTWGKWYIDRRTGALHDPSGDAVYESHKGKFIESRSYECVIPNLSRYDKKDLIDPRQYFKGTPDKEWLRTQFRKHGSWANMLYAQIIEDWQRMERIESQWISVLDMFVTIFVNGVDIATEFGGPFEFESSKDWAIIEEYVPETISGAWKYTRDYLKSIGAPAPDEQYPEEFLEQVIDQLHGA